MALTLPAPRAERCEALFITTGLRTALTIVVLDMSTLDLILKAKRAERFQCDEGSPAEWLLDEMRKRVGPRVSIGRNRGEPMQLEIGLVEDLRFNAFATTLNGVDVIGVNSGVYPLLVGAFRALMRVRSFFPTVGDVTAVEEADAAPFSAREAAERALLAHFPPHPDPVREAFGRRLAIFAMTAVLEHEFAHICNGHCDWALEQCGSGQIVEMASGGASKIDPLDRQTLEWDADCAAVQSVLESALQPEVTLVDGIGVWRVPAINEFGSMADGVRATIAVFFVIHAFFASENDIIGLADSERTHPNPSVRLHAVVRSISHMLHFRTGSDDQVEIKSCVEAAVDVLKAWAVIFPVQGGVKQHPYASTSVINLYENAIATYKSRWSLMHPTLDQYKRGGRIAPPEYQPNPAFSRE